MNIKFIEKKFRLEILDINNYYYKFINCDFDVWNICEANFVDDFFDERFVFFEKKVNEVILNRKILIGDYECNKKLSGKYLIFHAHEVMYDGLSNEYSKCFFDFNDVPPPEFWLGFIGGELISFIPDSYLVQANEGIKKCVSGCLEWV